MVWRVIEMMYRGMGMFVKKFLPTSSDIGSNVAFIVVFVTIACR